MLLQGLAWLHVELSERVRIAVSEFNGILAQRPHGHSKHLWVVTSDVKYCDYQSYVIDIKRYAIFLAQAYCVLTTVSTTQLFVVCIAHSFCGNPGMNICLDSTLPFKVFSHGCCGHAVMSISVKSLSLYRIIYSPRHSVTPLSI
jgi:hypothetical protein